MERLCGVINWQQAGWVDGWLKLYRISYGVAQKSLIMCDFRHCTSISLGSPSGGPLQREGWLGTVLAKSQSFVFLYTSMAIVSTAHKQTGHQAEAVSSLSERWDTGLIPGSQCLRTWASFSPLSFCTVSGLPFWDLFYLFIYLFTYLLTYFAFLLQSQQ